MNVARTTTSAVADRFRIEDEVWDEAFASRVSTRPRRNATPKSRPAHDWFADPGAALRPYGVDPPAELETPFGVDLSEADSFGESTVDRLGGVSTVAELAHPAQIAHIQGRGAERNLPVSRPEARLPMAARRRTMVERASGFEPDRLAMWAMFLGVALAAMAILSSSL